MKIRKFNESIEEENESKYVWVVTNENEEMVGFNSYFAAADYFIKYVNENYLEDGDDPFEPMIEGDTRLFNSVNENKDWNLCRDYVEQNDLALYLEEVPIISSRYDYLG